GAVASGPPRWGRARPRSAGRARGGQGRARARGCAPMRRRGALVLPLAALVLCACEDPPQLEPKRPKPTLAREAIRLDDGLDVELLAGPCGGATAVAVLFEVGADHDPPERSGMASVVARLLAAAAGDDRIVTSGRDHTLVASSPPPEELEAELEQL